MLKILGSLLGAVGLLWAGSVTATVDLDKVYKGDTVLLTLAMTGKKVDVLPDIPEINGQKVFNLQRRTTNNFVHVNGVSSMEKTNMMIMEFRPDKNMTIPSFSVKVDGEMKSTKPIKVTVLPSPTGAKRANSNFALDIAIEKKKFYLGESIVLNLYFKQRSNLDVLEIKYMPPAFKDFFSKQIGEGKTYKKGAFTIQELNYLLIAKKAGALTLEPARAEIAQRSRERQEGGWYIDVPKWSKISSSALNVEVIEPTEPHDIVGKFKLTDTLDTLKVKANKPVTLRMELLGLGTLDDYDGINFKIPSVTIYSDDAKVESRLMGKKLQSRYQKSFVFIGDHSFTIPSQEIRAYDYTTGKIEILKTKAYMIEVENTASLDPKALATQSEVESRIALPPIRSQLNMEKRTTLYSLFLAFLLGVVLTLLFKYITPFVVSKWRRKRKHFNGEEAFKILYPKMSESKEVEEMVRQLYAIKSGAKDIRIDREKLKEMVARYKRIEIN